MKGTFNIGKQEILLKDMNKKLQNMLEETLMKNIQLQKVKRIFHVVNDLEICKWNACKNVWKKNEQILKFVGV